MIQHNKPTIEKDDIKSVEGVLNSKWIAPGEKVKELVDWCYHGPGSAIVEKVDIEWEKYRGEFNSFGIRG